MSCCRGRSGAQQRRTALHPDCAELEEAGALLTLYPTNTNTGMKLVVRTKRHGVVELSSFLSVMSCGGATSTTLKRYAGQLTALAANNPTKLAPYTSSGLSLAAAIKLL